VQTIEIGGYLIDTGATGVGESYEAVEHVADRGHEVEVTYRGEPHRFAAAVLACPLPIVAEICPDRASVLGPLNDAIGYTKCLTVAVGCSVEPESPAMLVELPRCEDEAVALLFLDHNKCSDRAPAGRGLIGCFWEAHAASAMFDASDEQIAKHTLATVLRVFPELRGKVEFTHVSRWARALPHTQIGAYRRSASSTPGSIPCPGSSLRATTCRQRVRTRRSSSAAAQLRISSAHGSAPGISARRFRRWFRHERAVPAGYGYTRFRLG
jgi:predicted NAD/FAD-dependent oxidoreductase